MAVYEYKYIIGLNDVNKSNKIKNKAILKVLENGGGMHSEAVGYGLNEMEKTHISWILLGWKVKVIYRPNYNEEITIKTWGRNFSRVSTYRDFEVYDEKGKLCIIATSKWAAIDIKEGKLKELTPEIIEPYQCEERAVFQDGNIEKLKEPKEIQTKTEYVATRRDIDINNHVHNLYYLDFAYEALPEEVYRAEECNNIEIMYKKQVQLNDHIICSYTKENNQNIVTIKSKDESALHTIIKLY
ncbi:MAG: acyl-[acyl-carrier-protein] thioesterase [Clostridia bacterium]